MKGFLARKLRRNQRLAEAVAKAQPPSAARMKFALRAQMDAKAESVLRVHRSRPLSTADVAKAMGQSVMVAAYTLRRLEQLGTVSKRVISKPVKGRVTNTVSTYVHKAHIAKPPSVFPEWLLPPLPDIDYSRRLVKGVAGFMGRDESEESEEDQPQENVA